MLRRPEKPLEGAEKERSVKRKVLLSKIHRATITHADLSYEGSISLPPELMQASGIDEYEAVNVWNVTNGNRLETYAIRGQTASTDISINGAAAHLVNPGDLVIIACFGFLDSEQVSAHKPKLVFVDQNNRIKELRDEIPGPLRAVSCSNC